MFVAFYLDSQEQLVIIGVEQVHCQFNVELVVNDIILKDFFKRLHRSVLSNKVLAKMRDR